MTEKLSRRTLISAMGLAPVAVGTEAFIDMTKAEEMGVAHAHQATDNTIAAALRALAREIDEGRLKTTSIKVESRIEPNTLVEHTIIVRGFFDPTVPS